MAYLVSAVLFSLIFAIANSATLSIGHPYNKTIGPYNLQTVATLYIEHNANISICIVAAEFGLPAYTLYSADYCIWFYQYNTTKLVNETATLPLLNMEYTIGIYYSDDEKQNATVEVFEATNAVCPLGQMYDGYNKCENTTTIDNWNYTMPFNISKNENIIFEWENPSNVGYFEFSYNSPVEQTILYARYNGAPSKDHHDGQEKDGKLTIASPKPGKWYFSLHGTADSKASVFFTGRVCTEFLAGKDCNIHINEANDILNLTLTTATVYYRVVVNKTNINSTNIGSLVASVTTANNSLLPYLYASRGQIPDKSTADIRNCNRGYCNDVRSVLHNSTSNGEVWYIAIVPSGTGNVTAAVWFGQNCIPNCEDDSHGECQDSGLCQCEIDYDGINCNHSKGLGPQYIVLIIIASLVVASAFIGFVAWAYMRQKRGAYEPLS